MRVRNAYQHASADGATVQRDRAVRSSVALSLAGKSVELATLLLLATVVPRALGPSDYGRFAVLLSIVTIGSLALTLGGPTVMARFVPAAPPHERLAVARTLGARLARGRAAQLVVVAVVAAGASLVDPERFPVSTTAIVMVALALNVATTLALQIMLGLGRTGPWVARYPLHNAVLIGAVLVLHPVTADRGPLLAILVAAIAGATFALAAVRHVLAERTDAVDIPTGAIRFGTLHAAGAALVQVSGRGSVLAVAVLGGSHAESGFAALAIGVALGITYAVLQSFMVALPHLSGTELSAGSSGVGTSEVLLRRLAGGLLALFVPAAVMLACVLGTVVPVVFGDDYDGAADAFGPAIALVVLAPLSALVAQAAALRLRPDVSLLSGIASILAFAIVAVTTVPRWGAAAGTGAALAGSAAGVVTSMSLLPGAAGTRLAWSSLVGAAAVVVITFAT